jgi:hypothetical protein
MDQMKPVNVNSVLNLLLVLARNVIHVVINVSVGDNSILSVLECFLLIIDYINQTGRKYHIMFKLEIEFR